MLMRSRKSRHSLNDHNGELTNADDLWRNAKLAERFKTIATPGIVYRPAGYYLSALFRAGLLLIADADVKDNDIVLQVTFENKSMNVLFGGLDQDVQVDASETVSTLLKQALKGTPCLQAE